MNDVRSDLVSGQVIERLAGTGEPSVCITLYQALLKSDRFEFVLQKGTELGVSTFVPMLTDRVVSHGQNRVGAKSARWRRIVTEASEQSGRSRIPVIHDPVTLRSACENALPIAIMPWENEADPVHVKTVIAQARENGWEGSNVEIFIGPEGGFTLEEVELARSLNVLTLSLGQRILRSDTAAIATVSIICYELGEIGGEGEG